jgi:hypothetical protein
MSQSKPHANQKRTKIRAIPGHFPSVVRVARSVCTLMVRDFAALHHLGDSRFFSVVS